MPSKTGHTLVWAMTHDMAGYKLNEAHTLNTKYILRYPHIPTLDIIHHLAYNRLSYGAPSETNRDTIYTISRLL